jgi:hypothetical protein
VLWDVGKVYLNLPFALSAQVKSDESVQLAYPSSSEGLAGLHDHPCQPRQYITQESDTEASSHICTGSLLLTVKWRSSIVNLRDAVKSYLNAPWRDEPYNQAFPELTLYLGGLEHNPWNGLETSLKAEKRKSEQQVQLFGASIPARDLQWWGGLIIFCVQLYFYLHLRVLRSRIQRDDLAWEVAWIGVYRDRPSKLITVASGLLLPLTVTLYLTGGNFPLLPVGFWMTLRFWVFVGSAVWANVAGYELWRLWRAQAYVAG